MHESYKKWLENGQPKVYCQCGCNDEIIIKKHHIQYGIPKCLQYHFSEETKQKMKNNHRDISGENNPNFRKFGENNHNFGKHRTEEIKQKIREKHLGKHRTEEIKQKIRENHADMSGENNPMFNKKHNEKTKQKIRESAWKGGITPLYKIIRNSNKYKEWRLQIFGRDNFTCQYCAIRGTYLEAHHIIPFSKIIEKYNIENIEDALNCEILWNLNNGITYCIKCHNKLKNKGGILEKLP